MDFLIQTAWYSFEPHGHVMAFHGTLWVLQGTPMAFHGTLRYSMEFHGGISHGSFASLDHLMGFMELRLQTR